MPFLGDAAAGFAEGVGIGGAIHGIRDRKEAAKQRRELHEFNKRIYAANARQNEAAATGSELQLERSVLALQKDALEFTLQLHDGMDEFDSQQVLRLGQALLGDRIDDRQDGSKRLSDFVEDGQGNVMLEIEVRQPDGSMATAPFTDGRTSDPNDRVTRLPRLGLMQEMMDRNYALVDQAAEWAGIEGGREGGSYRQMLVKTLGAVNKALEASVAEEAGGEGTALMKNVGFIAEALGVDQAAAFRFLQQAKQNPHEAQRKLADSLAKYTARNFDGTFADGTTYETGPWRRAGIVLGLESPAGHGGELRAPPAGVPPEVQEAQQQGMLDRILAEGFQVRSGPRSGTKFSVKNPRGAGHLDITPIKIPGMPEDNLYDMTTAARDEAMQSRYEAIGEILKSMQPGDWTLAQDEGTGAVHLIYKVTLPDGRPKGEFLKGQDGQPIDMRSRLPEG